MKALIRVIRCTLLLLISCGSLLSLAQTKTPAPPPKAPGEVPRQRQAQVNELRQIAIPPLPPFNPQEPKRIALPNGMVLFLQEDHELPLISGFIRIRGGSRDEPANKTGMLDVYGTVWRTGGTKTRTGDQLDDFLEARAAKLETDSTSDSTIVSFNCLKPDFNDVFAAFMELLQQPEFREDKIDIVKRQIFGSISRRNDDVEEIAGREAAKLAYGPDNPYTRVDEYATIAAVTRQDLLDWHVRYVHPENSIFGITGDFDSAALEQKLQQAFSTWQKGSPISSPKIDFHPAPPALYFVPKTDVNQSSVQMVALGIERNNPDYFAVVVMNEVLGGGFSSRLVNTLRSQLGLAYSVGGGVGSAWDHPGVSQYSMATKSASTKQAIEGLRHELTNLLESPPTAVELKRAKDAILNSFVFNFDSREKVLAEKMRYEFYGFPLDFLERYRSAIEKVTADDVNRVAQKYVHPDQLAVLVVGNPTELGNQLSSLGPVKTIDITIPSPPGGPEEDNAPAQQAAPPQ
jgi:zinc protease